MGQFDHLTFLDDIIFGVPVSILSSFLVATGVFSFGFVLWRRLREDYTADQIFHLSLLVLFGGAVGWFVFSKLVYAELSAWGFLAGFILLAFWAIKRFNLRFFEVIDGLTCAFLWLWSFWTLGEVARLGLADRWMHMAEFLAAAGSLLTYYFFAGRYRTFSWYVSGKIGFAGIGALAVYFLSRFLLAFFLFWMLSSNTQVIQALISLVLFFILIVVIYLRSGRGFTGKNISHFYRRRHK